ncbi:MAG: DNA alkylation repair protein [bacterium]
MLARLRRMASPRDAAGMARFGIRPRTRVLGISIRQLRKIAKEIGKSHRLAGELWKSGIHEARILAGFVDEPDKVTEQQMERWVASFDSWDVVDQVSGLFTRTPFARKKIREWSVREEEFVKRAAFTFIAELAWHDTAMADAEFERFFPLIRRAAIDDRNFVKKAVNWALRNIGKRNRALNARAIQVAKDIRRLDSRPARWIASDTLRELTGPAVQARLSSRAGLPSVHR